MTVLLDASDRVVLDTCTLDHDRLLDDLTHDRYRLTPTAAALLAGCDGHQRVGALTTEHAQAYGVDPALLLEHLSAFVTELQEVGLARVRRSWRHRVLGMVLDRRPGRGGGTIARRRFPATPAGCARAAVHSGRVVAWGGLLASLAMVVAVAALSPGVALAAGLGPAAVTVASLVSVTAHEVSHLGAVRVVGGRARYAAAAPNQLGVIHDVHDPARRRWVGLAGPLGGALTATVTWPLVAVLPAPVDELALPLTLLLAAGHLAGLLPWFADGRHLWATTRSATTPWATWRRAGR